MTKSKSPAAVAGKTAQDVKAPRLTVQTARKPQDGGDLRAIAREVADQKRSADRVVGDVMFLAALTTHNAVEVSGAIGKEGVWSSQADYARAIGFSQPYVSRLKNLGRAAVVLGVQKQTEAWRFLCQNVTSQPVRKAVTDATDHADLVKRLKPLMAEVKEHGKITAGARPGAATTATEPDENGEEGATPGPIPTAGDARELLRKVESILRTLPDDEAAKVTRSMRAILKGDADRRTVAPTVKGEVVEAATA